MYVIYRQYSRDERPGESFIERCPLYGWTNDKKMIKLFLQQRSKDKYKIIKVSKEDIECDYEEPMNRSMMLDILQLQSVSIDEKMYFISTDNEVQTWEFKLHQMFEDAASLESIKGDGNYLELFHNIKEEYTDALAVLGYVPRELEALFPAAVLSMDEFEAELDSRHSCGDANKSLETASAKDKVIFSAEAFIKIFKDEM